MKHAAKTKNDYSEECKYCFYRFESQSLLNKHQSLKHSNKLFECYSCQTTFEDADEFKKHFATHQFQYEE